MKLLLTSGGISNDSIRHALVDLLGKPIAESSALYIPTAIYPFPGGAAMAWRLIRGGAGGPLCEVGWKSLGVLELTALPSIQEDCWVPMLQETDGPAGGRRRSPVSVPLDATVGTGRPVAPYASS
jgi:dipeptidase E